MENKDRPLVSFIVTCYDLPADMVAKCIGSILNLSLRNEEREIILVDDGSHNSIIDCLASQKDKITYIRQKNSGLSIARNNGLHAASGKYIQFVDGDDWLIREGYEQCLDIVRFAHPDVVMFGHTSGDRTHMSYSTPPCTSGAAYLQSHNMRAVAWGYTFRRDIMGELRFTPGIYHEDEEFTPQLLLKAEHVYDVDTTAYFYRKRPQSITTSKDKRKIIKRLDDVEGIIKRLDNVAQNMTSDKRLAMKRRIAQLTMDYIYNTMKLTKSVKQLEARIGRLEDKNLFPLPENHYTTKYTMFRNAIKNKTVRKLMCAILGRM